MTAGAIQVLFFASLRDRVGRAQLRLPLPEPPTLPGLLAALRAELGEAAEALAEESVRLAVNQELADAAVRLCPGDEVAFLPPVTGG